MTHNKKMLAAAVAAAFSLQAGSALAVGYFENVGTKHASIAAADMTGGTNIISAYDGTTKVATPSTTFNLGSAKVIDVVHNTTPTTGVVGMVYAWEMFQSSVGMPILPTCDGTGDNYAAVIYEFSTNLAGTVKVTFKLEEGAVFEGAPILGVSDAGGGTAKWTSLVTIEKGTGDGKTTAEFKLDTTTNALVEGDQLMLLYRLAKSSNLSEEGKDIQMTATVEGEFAKTIVIASSKKAIEAKIEAEIDTTVEISVSEGNKSFSPAGDNASASKISDLEAIIGSVTIENKSGGAALTNIYQCDGINEFKLLSGATGAAALDGASTPTDGADTKLFIDSGQFAASAGSNMIGLNESTPSATTNTGLSGGMTACDPDCVDTVNGTATIYLTEANIATIEGTTATAHKANIHLKVDGNTEIKLPENAPKATLTLDFTQGDDSAHDWGVQDIVVGPVDLLRIKRDGMVCWAYHVPPPGLKDKMNLRIINDSSVSGTFIGTLYDQAGGLVGTAVLAPVDRTTDPANPTPAAADWVLEAGKTFRVTSEDLEVIFGQTWIGRGMMQISSTLPKMEMLLFLRNVAPGSPLTNHSAGANGESCQ